MRIEFPRATGACLALVLVAACTPATQHAYVAPSRTTIVNTTEESQGPPEAHLIYIENRSTVPVTVFSVSLTGCENVRQQCTPHPVKIRVRPGGRELAMRVEPANKDQGFGYQFGFSWNADSAGVNALNALASNGDAAAQERLTAMQRADSLDRASGGIRELSREDFKTLGSRIASIRARSDSLVLEPGERFEMDHVSLLLLDSQGAVLGRTSWDRYLVNGGSAFSFIPPGTVLARRPGRGVARFRLADEALAMIGHPVADAPDLPIVVGYPFDAHAPVYEGIVTDGDSNAPLACTRVTLADSAQNVVARGVTDATGAFSLRAPRPGSYQVSVELTGWSPVHGPLEAGAADADVQHRYPVRFTDKLLSVSYADPDEFQYAYPVAVAASTYSQPQPAGSKKKKVRSGTIIRNVSLRGSATMPILNVVGNAQPGTTWVQFVVDSTGQVRPGSITLPPTADAPSVESVDLVLPHVRFSPARSMQHPTCELVRMQVNFSPR